MSEWRKEKLGNLVDSHLGKMLDKEKNKGEHQPYLANINVRWGTFDLSNLSTMRFQEHETERYSIKQDDLIICEGGEPGRCAIWEEQMPNMMIQKALHRVRARDSLDIKFLYYWFLLAGKAQRLEKYFTGSTIKHLPGDALSEIVLDLPSKEHQNAISTVLSNLDRKIAINNAINAELENTARMLYDYWFTQFEFPDADGKPYKSNNGEMVWNERLKWKIPKGWEVKAFGDICDVNKGSLITEKETSAGDIKVVAAGLNYSYLHSESNRPANTITISASGANAGVVNFWREEIFASDCITVRGKNTLDTLLAYQFLRFMQKVIFKKAIGSAQPHVYPDDIKLLWAYEIPLDLKSKIEATFISLNEKITCVQKESEELTTLRDFLLPLLMNGQVTVAAADASISDAASDSPAAEDKQAKKAAVFKRLVLSAYILDNICDEPTAGRVKFEKLLYLSEHCAQLPLHSQYKRAAAGPYDSRALYSIDSQLKKNKWFKRQNKKGESRAYTRMANAKGYKRYLDSNLNDREKTVVDRLIKLFKTFRTTQCEIIATLYSAWNDFIIDGTQPSDEQIVDEVLTNWHESKERIDRSRWLAALGWMRENAIVPTGYGAHTKR